MESIHFQTKVHNYLLRKRLCSFNSSMNSLTLSARLCLNAYNFLFSINVLSLKPDKEKSYGLPTVDCFFNDSNMSVPVKAYFSIS